MPEIFVEKMAEVIKEVVEFGKKDFLKKAGAPMPNNGESFKKGIEEVVQIFVSKALYEDGISTKLLKIENDIGRKLTSKERIEFLIKNVNHQEMNKRLEELKVKLIEEIKKIEP